MNMTEVIARINELAHKAKKEGLTPEELAAKQAAEEEAAFQTDPTLEEVMLEAEAESVETAEETEEEQHGDQD